MARRSRKRHLAIVGLLLLAGVGYRLHLAWRLPAGYDEVFVMSVGLEEMAASGAAFSCAVPLTRSSALTPLWWWLQYIPFGAAGELSLFTLRFLPGLLGAGTLIIAYLLCRGNWGRRAALVLLSLVSLSDVLAFTNGRGEFAESLMVPLLIAGASMIGHRNATAARGGVWLVLLGAGLSKGVFCVGLMVLAELTACFVRRDGILRRGQSLFVSLLIAALPVAGYLWWADAQFSNAALIHHEAAQAENVWQLAATLTFDYARVKAHVTAGQVDALRVWWDWGVWPATVVSLPLGVMGVAGALYCAMRRRRGTYTRRNAARIGLLAWVIVGIAVIVGRGTLGARFHLMYLPALWMLAALTVSTFRRNARAFLTTAYVMVAAYSLCVTGPTLWAPCARFEPMTGSAELAAFDAYRQKETVSVPAHGRTLCIDLANYYLVKQNHTQDDDRRALHFARLEAERVPNDPRAWAYLGEALLRNGALAREVRSAWERSLALLPNGKLRARLDRLGE